MSSPAPAPPDAIVVLGCRVDESGRLSPTLERRAAWGVVAYEARLGAFVVPCGGRRWGEHVEADCVASYLEAHGVPASAVFPELYSLTTAENAQFAAQTLRRIGARRALVVTCSWHMRRALACFRRAGVDALPLPVPSLPAPLSTRAYRAVHEVVSGRLDAWNLSRFARVGRARGGFAGGAA